MSKEYEVVWGDDDNSNDSEVNSNWGQDEVSNGYIVEWGDSDPINQSRPQEDDEPEGFVDAVTGATWNAFQNSKAAVNTWSGDSDAVVENSNDMVAVSKRQREFLQTLDASIAVADDDIVDAVGNAASAIWDNKLGALELLSAQIPNVGIVLGSVWAGAKVGSGIGLAAGSVIPGAGTAAGGVVGGIVGGIAGLFTSNIGIETGSKATEAAGDGIFTDEERDEVITKAAVKGSVLSAVDLATAGLSRVILGTTGKAIEKAVTRTFSDAGVDTTSEVAMRAAMRDNRIARDVMVNGGEAYKAATTTGVSARRGAAAYSNETLGETVGEYSGEYAAEGEASLTEAVLEGLISAPLNLGELKGLKALEQPGQATDIAQTDRSFKFDDQFSSDAAMEEVEGGIFSDDATSAIVSDPNIGTTTDRGASPVAAQLNPESPLGAMTVDLQSAPEGVPLHQWVGSKSQEIEMLTRPVSNTSNVPAALRPEPQISEEFKSEFEGAPRIEQPAPRDPTLYSEFTPEGMNVPMDGVTPQATPKPVAKAPKASKEPKVDPKFIEEQLNPKDEYAPQTEKEVEAELAAKRTAKPEPEIAEEFKDDNDSLPEMPKGKAREPKISSEFADSSDTLVDSDTKTATKQSDPKFDEQFANDQISETVAWADGVESVTPNKTGEGVLVKGDKTKIRAALTAAGIEAKGVGAKSGIRFPKKHAEAVQAALRKEATPTPPKKTVAAAKQEPATVESSNSNTSLSKSKGPVLQSQKDSKGRVTEVTASDSIEVVEGESIKTTEYKASRDGKSLTNAGLNLTIDEFNKDYTVEDPDIFEGATDVTVFQEKAGGGRFKPMLKVRLKGEVNGEFEISGSKSDPKDAEIAAQDDNQDAMLADLEASMDDGEFADEGPGPTDDGPVFSRKEAKPERKMGEVLTESSKTERKSKQLGRIKLKAETEEGETVTNTARYWLDDVDRRINEMNKFRGCAV